jgi:transcriptional regulator with XRE-family HTH domain
MIHACPKHPTPQASCYKNCGCRCAPCLALRGRQTKTRRHLASVGYRENIDVEPIALHVEELRQTMAVMEIAHTAGLSHDAVRRIHLRCNPKVSRRVARALLAVEPLAIEEQGIGIVNGCGTRRRLQALQAIGWTSVDVAAAMGVSHRTVSRWLRAKRVSASTRAAVAMVYEEMRYSVPPERTSQERGAASRARNTAARNKWRAPGFWADGKIDDPTARPRKTEARNNDSDEMAEEVERMLGTDSAQGIASRLGYADYDSLATVLARGGHKRMAERLRAAKVVAA